jgi:hypothetical protein
MKELKNWIELNIALLNSSEEFCKQLLDFEVKNKKRVTFVRRIFGRWAMLRNRSELAKVLRKISK